VRTDNEAGHRDGTNRTLAGQIGHSRHAGGGTTHRDNPSEGGLSGLSRRSLGARNQCPATAKQKGLGGLNTIPTEYEFDQLAAEAVVRIGRPIVAAYLISASNDVGWPIPASDRVRGGAGLALLVQQQERCCC
jgi:hypothetical protein